MQRAAAAELTASHGGSAFEIAVGAAVERMGEKEWH
jgi:hypothetical protein